MYSHDSHQLSFSEFLLPFDGKLEANNRWVQLAALVPWQSFEKDTQHSFPQTGGSPAKSFRMAFGALTLKERLNCSDGELVEQIRENPYLQYFLGLEKFSNKPSFLPCVTDSTEAESSPTKTTDNKVQLILDATYTPADISYPTDSKLLNKAREKSEELIDVIYSHCPQYPFKTQNISPNRS